MGPNDATFDAVPLGGTATAGPSDALVAELFAREATALVRLASLFCDDRNAAEDLVQEAFVRLHRSAGTIRDPERAPAFLRSIVINLARDHNRRGLMSLRHRSSMLAYSPPASVDDTTRTDLGEQALLASMRELPERQRAVLVLRYYLELSETETAETLGISQSSVKTHCRRGLSTLERRLEDPR